MLKYIRYLDIFLLRQGPRRTHWREACRRRKAKRPASVVGLAQPIPFCLHGHEIRDRVRNDHRPVRSADAGRVSCREHLPPGALSKGNGNDNFITDPDRDGGPDGPLTARAPTRCPSSFFVLS